MSPQTEVFLWACWGHRELQEFPVFPNGASGNVPLSFLLIWHLNMYCSVFNCCCVSEFLPQPDDTSFQGSATESHLLFPGLRWKQVLHGYVANIFVLGKIRQLGWE